MVRHRPTGRSLWTSTIVLLALTAVLAAVLGWQAWDAGRSHEAVARASLREQATFAATNFAREAREEVLFELLEEGVEVVESASGRSGDRSLTPERMYRASRSARWNGLEDAHLAFRLRLPGDAFEWSGPGGEEMAEWAKKEATAYAASRPDEHELEIGFAPRGPGMLVYEISYEGDGESSVYGLVLDPRAVAAAFERAFHDEPLLPETLTSGLTNDEIFIARIVAEDGRVVYESSGDSSSNVVRQAIHPELGGMMLELGVSDSAADLLVSGGVPDSRMPSILLLLLLTSGLLGTAVWQLRREAELAELRADFVSGVSHELMTPLTQIRMFGETLQLGRVRNAEERARAIEIIVDESTRLAHQVENVLMFSRGERDAMRLHPVETDLAALVEEVIDGYEPLAESAGASIRLAIDSERRSVVDPDATRQILLNLLDNAVKYGPSGQVLEVGLTAFDGGRRVILWVEDEGPGIPESDRHRIWDPYVRLDRDRDGSSGGSGIGLSVVRRAVEAQGGKVRAEDSHRAGSGTRFVIELPAAPVPA
jgi:signal transduction histidine kinase